MLLKMENERPSNSIFLTFQCFSLMNQFPFFLEIFLKDRIRGSFLSLVKDSASIRKNEKRREVL